MNKLVLIIVFVILFLLALSLALYPLRHLSKTLKASVALCLGTAFLLYSYYGAWPAWTTYLDEEAKEAKLQETLHTLDTSPQNLIAKLKTKLEHEPDSGRGWYLLGRLYASQGDWEQAKDAYQKAFQLEPEDELITVNYAQSLWELNHREFNDKTRDLLQQLLKRNKNQPDALAMLAMDAYLRHADEEAIEYWQRLLKQVPSHAPEAEAIRKAMAKAEQRLLKIKKVP